MFAATCVWLAEAAETSEATRVTVPVRPFTLLTDWFDRTPVAKSVIFATTCVWLADAAETSEAASVTAPVRPFTLCTGTSRPMTVKTPEVVVTVIFAPAVT